MLILSTNQKVTELENVTTNPKTTPYNIGRKIGENIRSDTLEGSIAKSGIARKVKYTGDVDKQISGNN